MKRVFLTFYLFLIGSLLLVQFVFGPVLSKVARIYLHDAIVEYNRQLAKGAFFTLELDLLRLPAEQWQSRIAELEPQFGYAIALLPYGELRLPAHQLDQLQQGEIAVVDEGELLYHRVGQSGMVLRKGPFSGLEPSAGLLGLIFWLALSAVAGLLTLLWIIPYWRKLHRISAAAIAFGNGDFRVRTDISKRSSLTPIATAFNTMAERIEELISSHKELTNAVSHELRTPLSRLRFGLEMLETADESDTRAHYARELQTDVEELEELVSELLTYARFDREKPELQFGEQNLFSFLDQLLAETMGDDCPVDYQIYCRLDDNSAMVRLEPKYLARALGNLLRNALRYAQSRIHITIERDGVNCLIHVDDDGPGIAPADRQRVFEPFTRLDKSRSRSSGGYGLGLAIVKRILSWHNGRAFIADSPQGGVRVTLCWPAFPADVKYCAVDGTKSA